VHNLYILCPQGVEAFRAPSALIADQPTHPVICARSVPRHSIATSPTSHGTSLATGCRLLGVDESDRGGFLASARADKD
jgi:hypothetical protein